MKILLIAGHGQGDPGACANGYQEADLAREVVTGINSELSQHIEADVFDVSVSLYSYLMSGKSFDFKKYDYVLEVHFNAGAGDANGNNTTTGSEILVHNNEESVSVEQLILKNLSALGFKNRGVKKRRNLLNMNVCRLVQGVSYALLEICFIDDADDMKLYQRKKGDVVAAVANGILDGFGIERVTTGENLLESGNDITWELNHSYFPISDTAKFVKELDEAKKNNSSLYWGYYKLVNKIK